MVHNLPLDCSYINKILAQDNMFINRVKIYFVAFIFSYTPLKLLSLSKACKDGASGQTF